MCGLTIPLLLLLPSVEYASIPKISSQSPAFTSQPPHFTLMEAKEQSARDWLASKTVKGGYTCFWLSDVASFLPPHDAPTNNALSFHLNRLIRGCRDSSGLYPTHENLNDARIRTLDILADIREKVDGNASESEVINLGEKVDDGVVTILWGNSMDCEGVDNGNNKDWELSDNDHGGSDGVISVFCHVNVKFRPAYLFSASSLPDSSSMIDLVLLSPFLSSSTTLRKEPWLKRSEWIVDRIPLEKERDRVISGFYNATGLSSLAMRFSGRPEAVITKFKPNSKRVQLLEGLTTNLFIKYEDDVLRTTPLKWGVLSGVGRRTVINDAETNGDESNVDITSGIYKDECKRWKVAFVTSALGVRRVGRIIDGESGDVLFFEGENTGNGGTTKNVSD